MLDMIGELVNMGLSDECLQMIFDENENVFAVKERYAKSPY
ncbi:MAG: hypothetical protein R3Y64_09785 [Peptostreptococcaceae bacterium]